MVSVLIPRIDRSGVYFGRLPGMICSISDHSGETFYRVLTAYGILNDGYRVSDLEPYCGIVNVEYDDYEKKYATISLTAAAEVHSARLGSVELVNTICNCNGICKTDNRCKCFKIGKKCISHCHAKSAKGNKNCKNC